MNKIALKRLSKSDLTFFTCQFRKLKTGNQKSINLNADVFIDKLYPDLPNISAKTGKVSFLVDLSIYGPGKASKHSLARKIVKGEAYKNWRLNGEFVENPIDMPDRYEVLEDGDYGIFIFGGDPVVDEVKLILVSANLSEDAVLHRHIKLLMGASSMRAMSSVDLHQAITEAGVDEYHAARMVDVESAFEDASQGGLDGINILRRWSAKRKITKEELKKVKDKADANGVVGEELVNFYLSQQLNLNLISNYSWASNENAIEAYDFIIDDAVYLDVKSTSSGFSQKMHVSINELLYMRDMPEYRIYRIYEILGDVAKLRISEPLAKFSTELLAKIDPLVPGVRVDNVSISPSVLHFSAEIIISVVYSGGE